MFRWKGNNLQVEIFGSSHAAEIGVRVLGFPCEKFNSQELLSFLERRKAKNKVYSTSRKEDDLPVFSAGVEKGRITGEVVAIIANNNVKSSDYLPLYGKPRPSHADYAAYCKDGRLDFSGGGEFSGRMTAPFCIAGGIAKQLLESRGIFVNAYVSSVGSVCGKSYKTEDISLEELQRQRDFPSLSNAEEMEAVIAFFKGQGDSVGGKVECVVHGLTAGVGGALFDGLEGKIAYLLYAIPAVKGVEFGSGFDLAQMTGSVANDPWRVDGDKIFATSNHAGGLNGGLSNGMPVTIAVAFRPTPSIAKTQQSVDLISRKNVEISVSGRHDACIVPRAVPVVEGAVCLAVLDSIL